MICMKNRWLAAAAYAACVLLGCASAMAAEGEGGASSGAGDLGQAIATVVIFLLLLAVLGRWAWRPIVSQLQQREQRIADTISAAQKREKEAQDLLESYRKRLDSVAA